MTHIVFIEAATRGRWIQMLKSCMDGSSTSHYLKVCVVMKNWVSGSNTKFIVIDFTMLPGDSTRSQIGRHSSRIPQQNISQWKFKQLSTEFMRNPRTPGTFALIKDLLSHILPFFHRLWFKVFLAKLLIPALLLQGSNTPRAAFLMRLPGPASILYPWLSLCLTQDYTTSITAIAGTYYRLCKCYACLQMSCTIIIMP